MHIPARVSTSKVRIIQFHEDISQLYAHTYVNER